MQNLGLIDAVYMHDTGQLAQLPGVINLKEVRQRRGTTTLAARYSWRRHLHLKIDVLTRYQQRAHRPA